MKKKSFIPIVVATLLLLFFLPQHVVSQKWPKKNIIETLLNPRRYLITVKRDVKPHIRTIAQLEALRRQSNIAHEKKRDSRPKKNVEFHEGLRRMNLDRQLPFPFRSHQNVFIPNSPRPTPRWTICLLRTIASSFKTNPSLPLCGKWRVIERENNNHQLKSESINKYHTILKDEYINISKDSVSYFSCGQSILSIDILSNFMVSSDNETLQITWIDEDFITLDVHFGDSNEKLILHRVTENIPSPIGHADIGSNTASKISSVSIKSPLHKVESDTQIDANRDNIELTTIPASNDDAKWWEKYIQNLIEDQMIQQGKVKIEQLFDNKRDSQPNEMEKLYKLIPIRHDIKQEGDRNTSYIYYYAYGYELAA